MIKKPHQLHPISWFLRDCINYFDQLGFKVFQGPEVTDEWTNFDGLNVPEDHPARDVQDTFWLEDDRVLRTHNTSADLIAMKDSQPPARFIIPGRCYRNEKTDDSHEATFYQLDGFVIEKDLTMGHLISTLKGFFESLYGDDIEIRTRPHHYAFVEPGMDIDVKLEGRWIEMLGSGMLHPTVLKNMEVNPEKYKGFAFGMGVDRLMMLRYQIDDIRHSYSGKLKFLKQFQK